MKGLELGLSASDRLSLSGIQIGGEASITQTPISGLFTIGLLGSWQKLLCCGYSSLKVHNFHKSSLLMMVVQIVSYDYGNHNLQRQFYIKFFIVNILFHYLNENLH